MEAIDRGISGTWRLLRARRLRPVRIEQWNAQVRLWLSQMGFFEVLDVDANLPPMEPPPQSMIRFKSGAENLGQPMKDLRLEIANAGQSLENTQIVYDAVTEAMANSVEHAYKDAPQGVAPPRLGKRWWLSGSIDREAGRVRILFYDQGISIPAALPRSGVWERARGFMQRQNWVPDEIINDDGRMIQSAVESRRTGTGEDYRGRGMQNVRRAAATATGNRLRIISRQGYYTYTPEDGGQAISQRSALNGTLIEWDLSLGGNHPA